VNRMIVKDLCVEFAGRKIFTQVNLDIAGGNVIACLGPNGAGKTTLLRAMVGEIVPATGSVSIGSYNVDSSKGRDLLRSVGYLPEDAVLFDFLTGQEYLGFLARIYGVDASRKEWIRYRLDSFGLAEAGKALARTYSKGMKKKIALLAAFLYSPDIVLLDEPSANLDAAAMPLLQSLVDEVVERGGAVVFTTHDMELSGAIATDAIVLGEGRVVAQGNWGSVSAAIGPKVDSVTSQKSAPVEQ